MVSSSRRRGVAIATLLLPFALAGCSSSSSGVSAGTAGTPTVPVATSQGVDPAGPAPAPATSGPMVGVSTAPAVKVGETGKITSDVQVDIDAVRDLTVKAERPGERAGAAVAVRVTVHNGSSKQFSLGGMVVNAFYHGGVPGDSTTSGPSKELTGLLAAGKQKTGTYVFMVPKQYAQSLRLEVVSDQSPTIVQFTR
jgi:hypothetical protein